MSSKPNSEPDDKSPRPASIDQSVAAFKAAILTATELSRADRKKAMSNELEWGLWQIGRHIASEPGNNLAGLLAGPALGVIPMIEDLIWKTAAGLRSEKLNKEQRDELTAYAEQLDFALALIYRNLGFLISWRGERTSSSDLFCEAWCIAQGNSAKAAKLIRRCRDHFQENIVAEPENIVDDFAWETYQRVEELDRFADEFSDQVATAAPHMHGWPMIRQLHHDNRARFEAIAEKFKLGSAYPLDTSKNARFRADTPMVRYLDSLVCRLEYVRGITRSLQYSSIEEEKESLRGWWRDASDEKPNDAVVEVLRVIRQMSALTKPTAMEWAKKAVVPLILVTEGSDWSNCKEKALQQVARQHGVKSVATFKSRLLAAVIPTLRSMARPG